MTTATATIGFDRKRVRRLASVVTDQLGIRLPEAKLEMLYSRLQRRLRLLELDSLADYEARLADPRYAAAERTALFDLATTNKTDFFREPAHFDYLVDTALPQLAAGRSRWTLRVWCAGCSSGQEAYTLAMVLADHAARNPGFDFSIVGTDISTAVLAQAAAATYDAALVAPVPAALRARYVMRGRGAQAGKVRIVPELRAKVRLGRLNFMDETYGVPDDFDVVFFRNVLIYFERPTQEAVINRQMRHLRTGGYLFVAHTESLSGLDVPLTQVGTSVFRRQR